MLFLTYNTLQYIVAYTVQQSKTVLITGFSHLYLLKYTCLSILIVFEISRGVEGTCFFI